MAVHQEGDKDKDKQKEKRKEDDAVAVDDLGGIRSAREARLIAKIQTLTSSLPKPLTKTAYLMECEPAHGTDVMRQHLCLEMEVSFGRDKALL